MDELPHRIAEYLASANVSMSVSLAGEADHPLVRVNHAFCRLTGYRADEVVGRNCRLLQGRLREQPAHASLREFLADPSQLRVRVQIINFKSDGTPFVNQLTLSRIMASGGATRYVLGTQFDVTAAAPTDLIDYDERLAALAGRTRSKMERAILVGSAQSMAEAAAAIVQAQMLIEDAERAGLLG